MSQIARRARRFSAFQPADDTRTFDEWSLDQAKASLANPGRLMTLEEYIRERERKDDEKAGKAERAGAGTA